ncbi:MAG TPA: hypothetical protein VJM11_03555 [Nevskiaceae bacterium]|nr:hypothetical protein [Nevskiaceae bacterium]
MAMTERGQIILIWWGLIMMLIYGFTLWLGFDMVGPPSPKLTPEEVAAFYTQDNLAKRLAAMITSWTAAFAVPIAVVAGIQVARLEKGTPVWGITTVVSGALMSIFLVLPPLFWGVAAYSPARDPQATALMHELGMLTLTTTDQFYIFGMVAITIVSLSRDDHDERSAFPRWMGFFTIWAAIAFEVGAFAFIPRSGPFSWNGVVVFWMPFWVYGTWITVMSFKMLRAIRHQAGERKAAAAKLATA